MDTGGIKSIDSLLLDRQSKVPRPEMAAGQTPAEVLASRSKYMRVYWPSSPDRAGVPCSVLKAAW